MQNKGHGEWGAPDDERTDRGETPTRDEAERMAGEDAERKSTYRARRRLLKIGLYTPPLVIGTLLLSREAWAQASCGPSACNPANSCGPNVCAPSSGCNPNSCNPAG